MQNANIAATIQTFIATPAPSETNSGFATPINEIGRSSVAHISIQ
jgi:hypothetical protein